MISLFFDPDVRTLAFLISEMFITMQRFSYVLPTQGLLR